MKVQRALTVVLFVSVATTFALAGSGQIHDAWWNGPERSWLSEGGPADDRVPLWGAIFSDLPIDHRVTTDCRGPRSRLWSSSCSLTPLTAPARPMLLGADSCTSCIGAPVSVDR